MSILFYLRAIVSPEGTPLEDQTEALVKRIPRGSMSEAINPAPVTITEKLVVFG